jgi:muconolactone D-isomerase
MIEFLTQATVSPPAGITPAALEDLRRRESARAAELAAQGRLVRAWRPHAAAGWANVCLWRAEDEQDLWQTLATLPFFPHMTVEVRQLDPHPNDPKSRVNPS